MKMLSLDLEQVKKCIDMLEGLLAKPGREIFETLVPTRLLHILDRASVSISELLSA